MSNGRPRKTAEELDAEMDDYWTTAGTAPGQNGNGDVAVAQPQGDDIDMIE